MTQPRLIDITDERGNFTGQQMTLEEANNKGAWHRTAHIIMFTPDKQILVQKRSPSIIRHPGMIDISVGGVIFSGETAEQAIVRRVYEEVGVRIIAADLQFIGTTKYNHRLPSYGKHVRVNLYNFIIELPSANVTLRYLKNEVSWAGFISWKQTEQLVNQGSLESIGKLMPRYSYYKTFLQEIKYA